MRLTPWFPGDVKPVRDGVYERKFLDSCGWYAMFYRGQWKSVRLSVQDAKEHRGASMQQAAYLWRGLAQDPNKR